MIIDSLKYDSKEFIFPHLYSSRFFREIVLEPMKSSEVRFLS